MKRWEVKSVKTGAIWQVLNEPICMFDMQKN